MVVGVLQMRLLVREAQTLKDKRHVIKGLRERLRHEFNAPLNDIIAAYPAHLHTNIGDPAMRGLGLGGHMMRALLDYLRQNGVKGVHLG
ncbi:MAG: DUF503 family protein, partial [Planctomycetota bacterium]|nr:DUF503 family protein [Planctomycetota bacterium]